MLFKGEFSVFVKTDKTKEKFYETVKSHLDSVGRTEISENGRMQIDATKFDSFFHTSSITGTITANEGYKVEVDCEVKPKWLIIIIAAICTCGLGIALMYFAVFARVKMIAKCGNALLNLKDSMR